MKIANLMLILILCYGSVHVAKAQTKPTAEEIVSNAEKKWQGTTSQSTMTMTIIRPTWQRTISMKSWSEGRKKSLTLITSPAREKGQTFLKIDTEMWSWSPAISRMIKLPPAMLGQGWMGSDYSNDDILKESSIVVDYEHSFAGAEDIKGIACYKINLKPKADAAVVWGRIVLWIGKTSLDQMKAEYYDEENYLVKTHNMSDIKKMGDRIIPTRIEIIPADEAGHKTILTIDKSVFDKDIKDRFFSKQNMKRVR